MPLLHPYWQHFDNKVIHATTFNVLQINSVSIKPSNTKLYSYGWNKPVKFLGKFNANIIREISNVDAFSWVTKAKDSVCLLSNDTAAQLELISFNI